MREFYVYGFKSREEYSIKSARSYDNERRRIESWIGDFMSFHQDTSGKNVFLSVDSRRIPHNPLHKAFKAKSFTDKDITLHFYVMDLLADGSALSSREIVDCINDDYYAIIDLVSGKKENVLQYLSAYLDEKIKSLKTESGIFTAEDFTYILVVPLKEGFPGMWSAIGRMLDRDDVEAGIPEMCAALDHLYYDSKNESIIESLTQVLQCNPKILLAKELLGYTYYNMQMLGNALSYFEQFEDGKPTSRIFLEGTVYFWMAWCYGKKKDCLKEEEYYRKSLEALPVGENTLNNLGYSLYKQRKFKEAQSVFEDCLRQNRDVRYAANNLVRTLLAQGKNGEAQRVIQEHERFVSKDLKKRAEKPVGKVKIAVPEPAVTDVEAETIVDIGVKKQQFSSEKLLEDELVQRMEIGIPVFGMPLRIYQKRGVYGRQFVLRNGRLDILGIDTAGDLYVIELKKDSGYDDAYAQTREYIDWIEEDVAVKGQRVFGIICLNDPTKDLIEKVKADDQMRLFEYSILFSVK